jgi:TPR repeat protein
MNGEGVPAKGAVMAHDLKLAADQGIVGAQCAIGRCFYFGDGVPANAALVVRYFQLAADQGIVEAQCAIGRCFHNGEGVPTDLALAVRYFQLAADQEIAEAQHNIGCCLLQGDGVRADPVLGAHYLKLAADQGHCQGQEYYGRKLLIGDGVPENLDCAVGYLKLAADQGYARAQAIYGWTLATSRCSAGSPTLGARYAKMAADQGDPEGMTFIGMLHLAGHGVPRDESLGRHYIRAAADSGHGPAIRVYLRIGPPGDEVRRYTVADVERAAASGTFDSRMPIPASASCLRCANAILSIGMARIEQCAREGNAKAQYMYGWWLATGNELLAAGDDSDLEAGMAPAMQLLLGERVAMYGARAVHYFQLSADQGFATAHFFLVHCLANGIGIDADPCLALFYYDLAADQGWRESQICYARLLECIIPTERQCVLELYRRAAGQNLVFAQFRYAHLLASMDDGLVNSSRTQQVDQLLANEGRLAMNGGELSLIRQLHYHLRRDEQTEDW